MAESPDLARIHRWVELVNFERSPRWNWAFQAHIVAWILGTLFFASVLRSTLRPITTSHEATALGGDSYEAHHYGMVLEKRKSIFAEFAETEIKERQRAIDQNTWGGHAWSREDDRAHAEMVLARKLAVRHGLTLTQIYMVLDEGIREKWPGPDERPLPPTTPPQDPRSTW
jgi:hypothetical protein